jgi:ribosomal protein S18 acetylase RimI-like enzyme
MTDPQAAAVIVETEPDLKDVQLLEDWLYEFNVQATGIDDGKLFSLFLRRPDGSIIGGAYGWSWGDTCYLRYLFVPADLRNKGYGTRLMRTVEQEACQRGCRQIVLETHDFQAPEFYRKLGFEVTGIVPEYPRGHQFFTLIKQLPSEEQMSVLD